MSTSGLAAESGEAKAPAAAELRCENRERKGFQADVGNNLRNRNFDWLERTGELLLRDDPRYVCGVSKLVDFYAAMEPQRAGGSDGPDARIGQFTAWETEKPESHWPKVGFSLVEEWLAYAARGNGTAAETSPTQWEGHNRHIKLAVEWDKKALAICSRDPQLYTHLIGLCRGAGCRRDQVDRWLAAALAINPKYDGVYIPMANSLVPRWLGDPDTFVDFAEEAADANKFLGNIVYVRIASVALGIDGDRLRRVYPRLSWDRILDGLRKIDARYPDSGRTYHLMARFAYLYEDRAVAQEAMARLKNGWRADSQYWDSPASFQKAYTWATGEAPGPF